jgi:hypothetical protein
VAAEFVRLASLLIDAQGVLEIAGGIRPARPTGVNSINYFSSVPVPSLEEALAQRRGLVSDVRVPDGAKARLRCSRSGEIGDLRLAGAHLLARRGDAPEAAGPEA